MMLRSALAGALLALAAFAGAADFHSTSEAAVLYDAPSLKAKPLYVLGRDVPLEVIVNVEGWLKVRDAGGSVTPVAGSRSPPRAQPNA